MARIRTIKPDFFTSDDVCALSPLARLLYIGLWCEADREGRMVWAPSTFKRRYLPEDACNADDVAGELMERGLIILYGKGLAYIPTFLEHQKVNPRESKSKLPPPEACPPEGDTSNLELHEQRGKEGKGKEGKESPSAKAEDGEPSLASAVFGPCLVWLQRASKKPEQHCRTFLGKARKSVGDEALIAILGNAQREGTIDPFGYITKAVLLRERQTGPPAQQGWN